MSIAFCSVASQSQSGVEGVSREDPDSSEPEPVSQRRSEAIGETAISGTGQDQGPGRVSPRDGRVVHTMGGSTG